MEKKREEGTAAAASQLSTREDARAGHEHSQHSGCRSRQIPEFEASLVYIVNSRLAKATLLVVREVQIEDTMRHRSFLYRNNTSSSMALGRSEWESWNPVYYGKNTN